MWCAATLSGIRSRWFFHTSRLKIIFCFAEIKLVPILGTQLDQNAVPKLDGEAKTTFSRSNLVLFGPILLVSPPPHPTWPAVWQANFCVVLPLLAQLGQYFLARLFCISASSSNSFNGFASIVFGSPAPCATADAGGRFSQPYRTPRFSQPYRTLKCY